MPVAHTSFARPPSSTICLPTVFDSCLAKFAELIDVAWAYNAQDIGKTLHGACSKLFADASANSWYKRLERAEAVQMLGEEFVAVANESEVLDRKSHDFMSRLEVAYQVAHMKVRVFFPLQKIARTQKDECNLRVFLVSLPCLCVP